MWNYNINDGTIFFQFEFYSSREFDTLSKRAMQFVLIKMLNKWDSSYDDNNVGN